MIELKELLSMPSVSGNEEKYCDCLKELMSRYCDRVVSDVSGNVYGICGNGKTKIVIDAHSDIIGLMVTEIAEDGLISFVPVGGVDTRILPSLPVVVHGRENIRGVIGVPPPHLQSGSTDKPYETEILKIDTGLTGEQLENIVEVGDFISFDSSFTELLNGRISMNGLDNKIGLYCALNIARNFKSNDLTLIIAATSGEEINLNGARVAANFDKFDLAIVIDVTHGATPDSVKDYTFSLGSGPAIAVGPGLSKKHSRFFEDIAKKCRIPYSIEVTSGSTGTNSLAYELTGSGILCCVVSIPLRYMHTCYETVDISDVSNTVKLITEFVNNYTEVEL